jgi:hypothetical protein
LFIILFFYDVLNYYFLVQKEGNGEKKIMKLNECSEA